MRRRRSFAVSKDIWTWHIFTDTKTTALHLSLDSCTASHSQLQRRFPLISLFQVHHCYALPPRLLIIRALLRRRTEAHTYICSTPPLSISLGSLRSTQSSLSQTLNLSPSCRNDREPPVASRRAPMELSPRSLVGQSPFLRMPEAYSAAQKWILIRVRQ
jgi:hypothetical protein